MYMYAMFAVMRSSAATGPRGWPMRNTLGRAVTRDTAPLALNAMSSPTLFMHPTTPFPQRRRLQPSSSPISSSPLRSSPLNPNYHLKNPPSQRRASASNQFLVQSRYTRPANKNSTFFGGIIASGAEPPPQKAVWRERFRQKCAERSERDRAKYRDAKRTQSEDGLSGTGSSRCDALGDDMDMDEGDAMDDSVSKHDHDPISQGYTCSERVFAYSCMVFLWPLSGDAKTMPTGYHMPMLSDRHSIPTWRTLKNMRGTLPGGPLLASLHRLQTYFPKKKKSIWRFSILLLGLAISTIRTRQNLRVPTWMWRLVHRLPLLSRIPVLLQEKIKSARLWICSSHRLAHTVTRRFLSILRMTLVILQWCVRCAPILFVSANPQARGLPCILLPPRK
jgi:hypothetical protein